ncbi:hypothetical protein PMAC_001864 [Pneumocystis sp. 'macacae']|nr:hypothetical protein PMAC_001864 [Pneumocystis sp. 'macacae']
MGCAISKESYSGKQRNEEIENQLKKDRITLRNEIKMLLLGAGESGKSTILKQMKLIHEGGYSVEERESFKEIIFSNTIQSMRVILEAMNALGILLGDMQNVCHMQVILDQPSQIEGEFLPQEIGDAIVCLWKDSGVQQCFQRSREYQLNDSAKYYFEAIDRIANPNYLPTDQDVLRSRVKTTGITETTFIIGDLVYRMFDVGGQRSERKKWIHCFENVTTIIFLVAISEYDQLLLEDETVNRMHEALTLFDSICNSRWFIKTSIILFLNKIDLFREKLPISPMKNYFSDYTGGDNYNAACDYILNRFVSLNQSDVKQIYTHFTCATDSTQIKFVMSAVNDIIVCKQWRTLFTNNKVAKILISSYFDKNIEDTSINNWYSIFENYAKKYIRFKKGKPKSFRQLYFHNKTSTCSLYSRLQDNYLILYNHATSESSNKGITLYHLKSNVTYEDAIYISTKNEGMLNVSLDSHILVGVNYFGVFYIWSLESLELIDTFKIESSDIAFILCYNNNVCIYTFNHILNVWNLKLKKIIFQIKLTQINPNLSNKHNIIAIEFLRKNNELVLCIENTTTNSGISYYEYRIYILSADHGHLLRHESLTNKHHPFKLNIIKKSELIIFYQFNDDHYWKMDLKTMKITLYLSHKNYIQELEYLIYPQNSLIIKYLRSIDNPSDDGLYVEKIDPENGVLMSKNKILESENIVYDQFHYLKNKHLLQGNDNWIIYNQRNKILLWEF